MTSNPTPLCLFAETWTSSDLKLLHTDPIHQKRGAGSMLLQWGVNEADRLGIPSYLEATREAHRLYERYGFREVERLAIDLSKWESGLTAEVSLMLRPAC